MAKVLYIAGLRHCGSTMVEAVLGAAPRTQSLGEVWGFFRYHTVGMQCLCSAPAAGCDLCVRVRKELDSEDRALELDLLNRLPVGGKKLSWIWRRTPTRVDYAKAADELFDAVERATGAEIIIDSSKNVTRLASLVADSRHEIYVLHLVRDPRGSRRSEERNAALFGVQASPMKALASWVVKNFLTSLVCKRVQQERRLELHYEAFVSDPEAALQSIGTMAGIDVTGLAERALTSGIERSHLYEPLRYADYELTRIEPERLQSQRLSAEANEAFWRRGGFLAKFWGYDKEQS